MSLPSAVWQPQAGSQERFLESPVREVLFHGTRGPGKTDALLMDFAQFVGRGFGAGWRGILFREESTQLADVRAKAQRWFPKMFEGARYLGGSEDKWVFKDGETLHFRHMRRPEEYNKYHGHEYPWIGWEELTNWPWSDCYDAMMTCNRSSYPGMPRRVRATCNPYGVGHGWVKDYFIDPVPNGHVFVTKHGRSRAAIFGSIFENKILMETDPEYYQNLLSISDENKRKAWLEGSWDIVAGGLFDGKWNAAVHVLDPFMIPRAWRVDRAFDWGSSKPYSVGFFAESNGEDVKIGETDDGDPIMRAFPKGTVILIGEDYGWSGKPNVGLHLTNKQIAERVKETEAGLRGRVIHPKATVHIGPADRSIFDVIDGDSMGKAFKRHGVPWTPSYKGAGSRVQGWERMGEMLLAANTELDDEGIRLPMEEPGLFVFNTCRQWIRTVPTLPRDTKKPDDADTDAEDHAGDMTRYRLLKRKRGELKEIELERTH